jgi:hypothetical protein
MEKVGQRRPKKRVLPAARRALHTFFLFTSDITDSWDRLAHTEAHASEPVLAALYRLHRFLFFFFSLGITGSEYG